MNMNKDRFFPIYRIYLTHRCNSDCVFCDTHNDVYKNIKEMPLQKVYDLIDEAISYGCEYIDFTGGQPLLYKHISEVLAYCQNKNIFCEVTTNGISDYDEEKGYSQVFLDCLKYASQINISLDSLDRNTYRSIRGVDTLEKVKKVIEHLPLEYKHKVKIIFTITKINVSKANEIMEYARKNEILVYFNPIFEYGRILYKAIDVENKNADVFNCLLDNMYDPYSMVHINFIELSNDALKGKKIHCGANRRIVTIMANGQIANPCYHYIKRELIDESEIANIDHTMVNCDECFVSSYFSFGVQYWLNKYSLLRGLSGCFDKLKSYIRNNKLTLKVDSKHLNKILLSYIEMIRDLEDYYDEDKVMVDKVCYDDRIYREKSAFEYAYDVSKLSRTPFKTLMQLLDELLKNTNINKNIDELPELLLRWFRWYSAKYFKLSNISYIEEDEKWIRQFLDGKVEFADCEIAKLTIEK